MKEANRRAAEMTFKIKLEPPSIHLYVQLTSYPFVYPFINASVHLSCNFFIHLSRNKGRPDNTLDLHCLHVDEALQALAEKFRGLTTG